MRIGYIGHIAFQVDNENLFTFNSLSRERNINLARHSVMDDRPKLQHTGRELDSLNFTILLKEFPGARESVDTRINKLLEMANAGNDQDVVFGAKYYGRWVIQSISVDHKEFHFGVTLSAKMNLKLTEYN